MVEMDDQVSKKTPESLDMNVKLITAVGKAKKIKKKTKKKDKKNIHLDLSRHLFIRLYKIEGRHFDAEKIA